MADNKVTVKIYGNEYTITGERDEKTIIEIADYVDQKIREIARVFSSTIPGQLATLSAVNMADELFAAREEIKALQERLDQCEKDTQHYMKLWDEAKENFVQYKEGAGKQYEEYSHAEDKYKELEDRYAELESTFFDIQMENIQLKSQLEKYTK